jgi:hypothetical protein
MFYYLFLYITPAPLTLPNHIGFFIWSAIPAFMLAFAMKKTRWIGFSILLIALISASSSLIYESFLAQVNNTGNLSAVLSYILIMIVAIVSTLIIEGSLLLFRIIRNK